MKKIILATILGTLLSNNANAQVAIGKPSVSSISASLDFESGNRGLILPWVTSTANHVAGTLIYDANAKKVKVKLMPTGSWQDLSINAGAVNLALQTPLTERSNAKVSIGAPTSTPGILVLEDNNKAMVLPKVDSPHLNILNPEPGTIVFDTKAQQLVVYNGTQWTFWN